MISEKQFTRGAIAALMVGFVGLGYNQMRAHADGIPAMRPLTYAGTLEEGSGPVTGTRNIRLTLWDVASGGGSSNIRCVTASGTPTQVTNGRFQIVLDEACVPAVRSTPDLWLEIEVNGATVGNRTKLSAVPFAIEANRANELTPAATNALVPTGTVVAFAGTPARVPAGWLLCDGRSVSRAMYPALSDAIGTAFGGDGTNFNLPDLRGRTVVGVGQGTGLTMRALGQNFGAESHTLTVAEMPSHAHAVRAGSARFVTYNASGAFGFTGATGVNQRVGDNDPNAEIAPTGGGMPHNNMQPSTAVHFIIKI